MFVDFDYYQNEYGGSELTEDEFNINAKKSERYLDSLMGNIIFYDRINNYPLKIQNLIKDCICENSEFINTNEDEKIIDSYSINGVSISYDNTNYSSNVKTSIYQELVSLGIISRILK